MDPQISRYQLGYLNAYMDRCIDNSENEVITILQKNNTYQKVLEINALINKQILSVCCLLNDLQIVSKIHLTTFTHRSLYLHFPGKWKPLCPYTDKQRLIKIAFNAQRLSWLPHLLKFLHFLLAQSIYQNSVDGVRWYIHRNGDILLKVLGLVFKFSISFSHPSTPFLCSSSFSSTHKPISHVGLMLKKIIHRSGCSIGK